MKGSKLASLAAVILVLAGAAYWLAPPEVADARPFVPAPGVTSDVASRVLPVAEPSDEVTALVPPEDTTAGDGASTDDGDAGPPPGHARIDVRVLTAATRAPVAGVGVELRLGPRPAVGEAIPHARTDDDGRVRWELPAPLRLRGLLVSSGGATGGARVDRQIALHAGDTRALEVLVPACGGLSGLVLDGFGNPVADASVVAWSRSLGQLPADSESAQMPDAETRSDGAGRFELSCVGPSFVISAVAPGRLCSVRMHGTLAPGESLGDLRLELIEPVSLEGRVTRDDGRPVSGVRVVATGREPYRPEFLTDRPKLFTCDAAEVSALSDEGGRFRFAALAPRALTFVVDLPDAPSLRVTHDPRDGELLLVLGSGCAVAGVVRGADGRPLADASVRVEGNMTPTRRARSDDEGRFRVVGLAPDPRARVLALADGHAPTVQQPIVVQAQQEAWVELRLETALSISGRLVDVLGRPLPAADLTLEGERLIASHQSRYPLPTWGRAFGLELTSTDAEGRFALGQLNPGGYRLEAVHPDEPALRRSFAVMAGEHDLLLVLDAGELGGVTLEGQVRDALTELPVSRFMVTPHRLLPDGTFSGRGRRVDDEQGRFFMTDVQPGELIVMVSASGYRHWSRPLGEYGAGRHEFDVALLPSRSLALRIVDEQGAPVSRATVYCLDATGSILWIAFGAGASSQFLGSDERGEVDVHELPASTITVVAEFDGEAASLEGQAGFDLRHPVTGRRVVVVSPRDG